MRLIPKGDGTMGVVLDKSQTRQMSDVSNMLRAVARLAEDKQAEELADALLLKARGLGPKYFNDSGEFQDSPARARTNESAPA